MDRFVQLHLLTSHAPANLNRDDLGRPKTAIMGGATRLRISSQSLKRAWRTSEVFAQALAGHLGTRTKEMGVRVCTRLLEAGAKDKNAREWARAIAGVFGTLESTKDGGEELDLRIKQLVHFSPEEMQAIDDLVTKLTERGSTPTDEELELLREGSIAADIAMFGRMLASKPRFNVEAAVQVAHAITVHKVAVENDFFTAVDDLNDGQDNIGAGHMGETEFGAGLFYQYICIDRQLLLENLGGREDLSQRAIAALVEAAAKVSPTGKQASFASRARASYIFCERGDVQPRSLAVAFLDPVSDRSVLASAIEKLTETGTRMAKAYGDEPAHVAVMDCHAGTGSLAEIIACATE